VTRRVLQNYPCPVCGEQISGVTVDEESIRSAPRVPVLIPAKCERGHQVVLFVDRNLEIREAEPVVPDSEQRKSSVDKAKKWFGHI